MDNPKYFLKKENGRYYYSSGLTWYAFPESVKNRNQLDEYWNNRIPNRKRNARTDLVYTDNDFKPLTYFDVKWRKGWNSTYMAINEGHEIVLNVPLNASDDELNQACQEYAEANNIERFIVNVNTDERPVTE